LLSPDAEIPPAPREGVISDLDFRGSGDEAAAKGPGVPGEAGTVARDLVGGQTVVGETVDDLARFEHCSVPPSTGNGCE
jgi:hypothetical protein